MASALVGDAHPAVVASEEQLRAAQLGADVGALDRLIADELLFTGPDGQLATKAQDLKSHRSGAVRLLMHEPEELRVRRVSEDVHVAALRARLGGWCFLSRGGHPRFMIIPGGCSCDAGTLLPG